MDDLNRLYGQVDVKLNHVSFKSLWPGFKQYGFALYTSQKVCFGGAETSWDERFMGNTAIPYEGRLIAIWDVEHDPPEGGDTDLLASNLVHEMFHAFQQECGETRFPDDLKTLMYPHDISNLQLKYAENLALAEAADVSDTVEKRARLNRFFGIRKKRRPLIGDMLDCELLSETAEGMAEYVGTLAMKALSPKKYAARTSQYTNILRTIDAVQLDVRRIAYYTGALLLLTARDAGIDFGHRVGDTNEAIFDIVCRSLSPEFPKDIRYDVRIGPLAEEVFQARARMVQAFLSTNPANTEGDYIITGYDPMNMIRSGDFILCRTFIRLTDAFKQTAECMTGETLLRMVPGSANRVLAFYRS